MTASVLLDTSFLISLVDRNRVHHTIAAQYYKLLLEQQSPIYFSAIVAAEISIKQPITDLPLKNFRSIPFTQKPRYSQLLLITAERLIFWGIKYG
jgi:PIN domain nuclease of toxin-antitoxin system